MLIHRRELIKQEVSGVNRKGEKKNQCMEELEWVEDRPTPFPLAFSCMASPASARVDGVLLPLLAAGLVEALGMTMSKVASGGGCCWEPRR